MRSVLRFSALLAATAVAFTLTATATSAQVTPACYPLCGQGPTVSTAAPSPGDCLTVSHSELAPGTVVTFVLKDSAGVTNSVSATANAAGVASAQICVPAGAATGAGDITASTATAVLGVSAINVGAAAPSGALAFTGRSLGDTLKVAVLAVIIGAVLVGLSRRREDELVTA